MGTRVIGIADHGPGFLEPHRWRKPRCLQLKVSLIGIQSDIQAQDDTNALRPKLSVFGENSVQVLNSHIR